MLKTQKNLAKPKQIALALLLLMLVLFPLMANGYTLQIGVYCGIFVLLAVSLNILIGYCGIFSMGHAAFYCLGAYTSALLATKAGLPFIVCFLAGGFVAALAGVLVGIATLRLSDLFLTFTTMGLSEVVRIVIQNADFTNGALGITGIPAPEWFGRSMNRVEFYYINIVAMVAIGGMGTISGPILGAVLLQVLPEAIRFLDNYRQLLFGAALVISVMFAPKGLVGLNWRKIGLIDRICARFESGKEE